MPERTTDGERARTADRFIDHLQDACSSIGAARQVLDEGKSQANSATLFLIRDQVLRLIDQARDALYDAHNSAAAFAYDAHRAAGHLQPEESPDA